MKAFVVRELRVKARRQKPALPRRDDRAVTEASEDLDAWADTTDSRRADEHSVERLLAERLHVEVRFEGVDLTTERVALHGHVHERRERVRMTGNVLRDEDRACTCAPHRHAFGDAVLELVDDPVLAGELADRRALAAGDDQRVDLVELLGSADVDAFHAEPIERGEMFREVALETEDPGARELGEALRRINEGAAMIRSKGEAGTGNIVEAVTHIRAITEGISQLTELGPDALEKRADEYRVPVELVRQVAKDGKLPVVLFCAGGIATPADAALMMQLGAEGNFVGSGIFKSADPARRAKAIVEATTHFRDAKLVAEVSRGLGEAMRGLSLDSIPAPERLAVRGW